MTDQEQYLEFWTPTLGADEAMRSWEVKKQRTQFSAPMVMGDLAPYISQIDGSLISSRSQHRNHLKSNGCIEVGNETSHLKNKGRKEDPRLKEMLIHTVNQKLSKHH